MSQISNKRYEETLATNDTITFTSSTGDKWVGEIVYDPGYEFSCDHCGTEMEETDGYSINDDRYCNTCACELEEQENLQFTIDDLAMPTLESSRELFCEADKFNDLYGTHYTQENLEKFDKYHFHYNLETKDAIEYIQTCHCCDEPLDIFAGEYCSGGCHNHVEELGLPCFRGADCLICKNQTICQCCGVDRWDFESPAEWPSPMYCSDNCLSAGYFQNDNTIPVPEFLQEVTQFNEECQTAFCQYSFNKLKLYAEQMKMTTTEAVYYSQQCHCCGYFNEQRTAEAFRPYCSERCRAAIEDDGDLCHRLDHNEPCLICENSGRKYDEYSAPPDFIRPIKNKCYRCLKDFAYPPFKYWSNEYVCVYEGMNQDLSIEACHDCFCKHSKRLSQFGQNYPVRDLRSHHPVISTISALKELHVYNLIDDLQVWADLSQYLQ
uniref:Uncharacterized protein n=1 Tax=viral metagenome TaxID=1070528 RepID=A0A6C0I8W4_9ZZZZ